MEFDHKALAGEQLWFTVTLVRSKSTDDLDGTVCALTRLVLMRFFDPNGHDSRRAGVTLRLRDGTRVHIYADFGMLLADEVAIKEMLGCKGHAGTKPCFFCANCVLHRQARAEQAWWERNPYFKSIAEMDLSVFVPHTDQSLRESVRRLHAAKPVMTKAEFGQLEQQYGWVYHEHDVLLDDHLQLNAIATTMWDWSHTYVANGVADVEFGDFMYVMRRTQTTYKELGRYVSSWTFPRQYSGINRLFKSQKKMKTYYKNKAFGCTASEFLTLAPVLASYLKRVVAVRDGSMDLYVSSMLAVLMVVEALQAVKCRNVSPACLKLRILDHLRRYVAAYGADAVRPKHHYALHLPEMLARHGTLVGTLTNERRHRVVKRYTRDRRCLLRWELGALEEMTCHSRWELSEPFLRSGHVNPTPPRPQALAVLRELFGDDARAGRELTMSNRVNARHGTIITNDCVLFEDPETHAHMASELLSNVAIGDDQLSIVSRWRHVGVSTDPRLRDYAIEDDVTIVPSGCLLVSCTHRQNDAATSSYVYVPLEFRV